MQFKSFHWLRHHELRAIILSSTGMVIGGELLFPLMLVK